MGYARRRRPHARWGAGRAGDAAIEGEGDAVADQPLPGFKDDAAGVFKRPCSIVIDEDRVVGAVESVRRTACGERRQARERTQVAAVAVATRIVAVNVPDAVRAHRDRDRRSLVAEEAFGIDGEILERRG